MATGGSRAGHKPKAAVESRAADAGFALLHGISFATNDPVRLRTIVAVRRLWLSCGQRHRRRKLMIVGRGATLAALGALLPATTRAQSAWPTRPIRLIV